MVDRLIVFLLVCILPNIILYRSFRRDPSRASIVIFTKDPSKITPGKPCELFTLVLFPHLFIEYSHIIFLRAKTCTIS
jgi:hypothetical protein